MPKSAVAIKGSPSRCLFSSTAGFFVGFAAVALFGPTANRFRELMELTPVMTGFLVAIPSLSGSLLRVPFGAWVDSTGGRKPFLILLFLALAGMLSLTGFIFLLYPAGLSAAHYPLLLLLGALCGCGIATFSVGISQVSYWFPQKKQGAALGTYAGVGNIAPGLFSLLVPLSLASWGLLASYLAWLFFLAAGIAIYLATGRNACYFQLVQNRVDPKAARIQACEFGQELFPKGNARQGLAAAARIWKTWVLVFIYFTTFGGFIALTAWLPTYWISLYGQTLTMAGVLTAVFSLLASVIRVPGGSLSDRLGGEKTALLALGTLLAGAAVMTFSRSFAMSVAGEVLMGAGMGVGNAAIFKLVPQYVKEAVGGASGWVGGLGAFGGFAIPPLMGLFVRNQGLPGYSTGFAIFIGLTVASLFLANLLRRTGKLEK
ncbi:MAG: MFS transporter [Chloroflexi bacterium]|nr:MFS transporter [Chloroflexota bacterium]